MSELSSSGLGFTWRQRKADVVELMHHGRLATTLRGRPALDFLDEVGSLDDSGAQQLMARLTGNYRRGNERVAASHPRNRR